MRFPEVSLDLDPGTALVSYTDGLTEQHTQDGSMLGEDGVRDLAVEAYGGDAPIQALLDGVLSRSPSNSFEDDLLVVWLERLAD